MIPFHNFPRTFIILPPESSQSFQHFLASTNSLAEDEVKVSASSSSSGVNFDSKLLLGPYRHVFAKDQ